MSGVGACRVVSHSSKHGLVDEPGLIRCQNDGGCDVGLQMLKNRRWSYLWDHLGHLFWFCHIFAEQTSGLEWTSIRDRPCANEVSNGYFQSGLGQVALSLSARVSPTWKWGSGAGVCSPSSPPAPGPTARGAGGSAPRPYPRVVRASRWICTVRW